MCVLGIDCPVSAGILGRVWSAGWPFGGGSPWSLYWGPPPVFSEAKPGRAWPPARPVRTGVPADSPPEELPVLRAALAARRAQPARADRAEPAVDRCRADQVALRAIRPAQRARQALRDPRAKPGQGDRPSAARATHSNAPATNREGGVLREDKLPCMLTGSFSARPPPGCGSGGATPSRRAPLPRPGLHARNRPKEPSCTAPL
jgi:hypothetical protein